MHSCKQGLCAGLFEARPAHPVHGTLTPGAEPSWKLSRTAGFLSRHRNMCVLHMRQAIHSQEVGGSQHLKGAPEHVTLAHKLAHTPLQATTLLGDNCGCAPGTNTAVMEGCCHQNNSTLDTVSSSCQTACCGAAVAVLPAECTCRHSPAPCGREKHGAACGPSQSRCLRKGIRSALLLLVLKVSTVLCWPLGDGALVGCSCAQPCTLSPLCLDLLQRRLQQAQQPQHNTQTAAITASVTALLRPRCSTCSSVCDLGMLPLTVPPATQRCMCCPTATTSPDPVANVPYLWYEVTPTAAGVAW